MQTIAFEVDDAAHQNLAILAKLRGYTNPDGSPDFARVFDAACRDAATHVALEVAPILAASASTSAQMLAAVDAKIEERAAEAKAAAELEAPVNESTPTNTTPEER